MRYIPMMQNAYLFLSLDSHGEKRDGRRLWPKSLEDLLETTVALAAPTQENLDVWMKANNRQN